MAHLLFVECNVPSIDAMRRAQELGHAVTLIKSTEFRFYPDTAATRSVLTSIGRTVEVASTADPMVLLGAMRSVYALTPIDAVVCQVEFSVEATAIACARLGLRFTSAEGVRNARNKGRTRSLMRDAGLRTPRTWSVTSMEEFDAVASELPLPVVVKPLSGADSILAFPASTREEAQQAVSRTLEGVERLPEMIRAQFRRGVLLEEMLVGELVSVELGALDGEFYRFMVSGRPRAVENECIELGVIMPATIDEQQRVMCFEYAENICRILGLDLGIFHVEMILTAHGPVLVEANPRLMGGVMPHLYQLVTGRDIHEDEFLIHLGTPVPGTTPLPVTDTAVTRKVMPRADGRADERGDWGWLDVFEDADKELLGYRLEPGMEVRAHEILARFVICGDDPENSGKTGDDLLHRFEESLGVELIR